MISGQFEFLNSSQLKKVTLFMKIQKKSQYCILNNTKITIV